MKNKFKITVFFIVLLGFISIVLTGCNRPKPEVELKLSGNKEATVEVSKTTEVTISVTPEDQVSGLTVVVDKTNIATATIASGKVTITGVSEGEAKATISHPEFEGVSHIITITVTKKADEPDPEIEYKNLTIEQMLQESKNNDYIETEAVVYGVVGESGVYLEDSDLGKIFATFSEAHELQKGNKVKVQGQFGLVAGFPRLKNLTLVENLGSVDEYGKPIHEKTIEELLALDKDSKSGAYANLFTTIATVVKTPAGIYQLHDEDGNYVLLTEFSNLTLLDDYLEKRVEFKQLIAHDFQASTNKWRFSFIGANEDVVEKPLTLEELRPIILEDFANRIEKNIHGILELPSAHPTMLSINYEWSVDSTVENISILDNEVIIDVDHFRTAEAEDQVVELKALVKSGDQELELTYEITLKQIIERSVSELLDDRPAINMSYVTVQGRVVARARNQGLSIRSLFIQDPATKAVVQFDFFPESEETPYVSYESTQYEEIKLGDDIKVDGQFRQDGRITVNNITKLDIVSTGNPVEHDKENAIVLNDLESYNAFGAGYEENMNKLVKLVNPYFLFSTTTPPTQTNWVIIVHDENGAQVYDQEIAKRRFAFLIANESEMFENERWIDSFDIPLFSNTDSTLQEIEIYAYMFNVSATYIQFIIPSYDEITISIEDKLDIYLAGKIRTNLVVGESIDLVDAKHIIGNETGITWSSSNDAVFNATTGVAGDVDEATTVVLTGTYTNTADETVTLTYSITVTPNEPITVKELLETAESNNFYRIEGYVIGFFSDGNNSGVRGLIIKDKVTSHSILLNDAVASNAAGYLGNYGEYKVGEELIEVGDEVFVKAKYLDDGVRQDLIADESMIIEIKSKNNELLFPEEGMLTISNQEEMVEFFTNPQIGRVIKFTATEEVPFAFGGSSTTYSSINYKFYYNVEATANNHVKYPDVDGKVVSFKGANNKANLGEEWWINYFNLPDRGFVAPTTSIPPFKRAGTIYGVLGGITSTYFQMSFVNPEGINTTVVGTDHVFE